MSLCPKGKSGVLKIAAVLCRAASKRTNSRVKSKEPDMICHVWRPKDSASLWDFYANFESMLQHRGVTDPYLKQALDPEMAGNQVALAKESTTRKSVMDHFERTGIDRLEDLMNKISINSNEKEERNFVQTSKDDADSDIEIDLSDDEDDDDNYDVEDNSDGHNEDVNSSQIVTLSKSIVDDATC